MHFLGHDVFFRTAAHCMGKLGPDEPAASPGDSLHRGSADWASAALPGRLSLSNGIRNSSESQLASLHSVCIFADILTWAALFLAHLQLR